MSLRAWSFVSFAVSVALAGCNPAPISVPCDPLCAPGFSCDTTTGQCVGGGVSVDMAATTGDMAGTCNPPCAMPTPFCNASKQCVACLADKDCAIGSYCKSSNLGASCVV